METISKDTLKFLNDLRKNNNRDWFNAKKERYDAALKNMVGFTDSLLDQLRLHDNIETESGKKSLFRIYRDVRFSKDKSPYKTHFAGGFKRATKALRGGYYFHVEPDAIFLAGGFWGPSKEDLLHIRQQIQMDPQPLRDIITSKSFVQHFGELKGEQLKSAPKGFEKDDPAIDLIRYKQFLVTEEIDHKLASSDELIPTMISGFKAMRPFFDHMSEILTTDLNGERII